MTGQRRPGSPLKYWKGPRCVPGAASEPRPGRCPTSPRSGRRIPQPPLSYLPINTAWSSTWPFIAFSTASFVLPSGRSNSQSRA